MEYEPDDYTLEMYDQAVSELIEQGIKDLRDENIASYLGSYGDAVQRRIDRCIEEAKQLTKEGHHAHAVVASVTSIELIIRYFILLPILHGAFLSEEWAKILIGRIMTQRSATDRELLPRVLKQWDIDLNTMTLADGSPLWDRFINELILLRNDIVHKGETAMSTQADKALMYVEAFLGSVVAPLSIKFGFSWVKTRIWHSTQQGIGGATSYRMFTEKSPF